MKYSKEFQKLINNPDKFADIMKYNESSKQYHDWGLRRKFISKAINKDGTILDIGCAGGMMLWSLMEWSGHKLTPYGVDIVPKYINAAKKLIPSHSNNFALLDVRDIRVIRDRGLPGSYDFVFWNYLGPKYFVDPNIETTIQNVINLANNRAIFAFYAPNNPRASLEEKRSEEEYLRKRVEDFKSEQEIDGELYNPTIYNQAIVWIDK